MKRNHIFLIFMAFMISNTTLGKVLYVDNDAPGGSGQSWQTAYKYLQDALVAAQSGDVVRVAHGRYTPDCNEACSQGTGDRTATFNLLNGVTLKGGYAGLSAVVQAGLAGVDPNVWDVELYETILSGDLAGNDVLTEDPCDFVPQVNEGTWSRPDQWCLLIESTRIENCLHVVSYTGLDQAASLEGFIITGGNAFCPPYSLGGRDSVMVFEDADRGAGIFHEGGSLSLKSCRLVLNSSMDSGGGIYSKETEQLVLENCDVNDNFGYRGVGGVYAVDVNELKVTGSDFNNNRSWHSYSAMYCHDCALNMNGCGFEENISIQARRVAMEARSCSGLLEQCHFERHDSGALVCNYSDLDLEACSFYANKAGYGGAMSSTGSSVSLYECKFKGNMATWEGGAVYSYENNIMFTKNHFYNNYAGTRGGGSTMLAIP